MPGLRAAGFDASYDRHGGQRRVGERRSGFAAKFPSASFCYAAAGESDEISGLSGRTASQQRIASTSSTAAM